MCSFVLFVFTNNHKKDTSQEYTTPFITSINNKNTLYNQNNYYKFNDGLPNSDTTVTYPLDEYKMGISEKSIFEIDINKDTKIDRITREFHETGNAHSYYTYKIELNNGGRFTDITPEDFQTINGDTCDLKLIRFSFVPKFTATIIYRDLGNTWEEPTEAYKQSFYLSKDKLVTSEKTILKPVCDVKELF